MNNQVMVSICCITYNHENYIADAIEGFLNQKTNFKYEVLIHDDASTDQTQQIIKKYEMKYPDIIKPIYQSENQYSKGISTFSILQKKVSGKYVAICEGDDYWIDESKLQKQVDYIEQNPECTFCFHNGYIENQATKNQMRPVIPWMPENRNYFFDQNRKYFAGELQLLGYIPTGSFLFPKRILDNPPKWFFEAPVGDNALKLLAASKGYAYYMNDAMCVYRYNVSGSATTNWQNENINQIVHRCNRFIKMLEDFNCYTNNQYHNEIELSKLTWEIQKLRLIEDYKELKNKKYKNYLNLLSGRDKLKASILLRFPVIMNYRRKLREHFNI